MNPTLRNLVYLDLLYNCLTLTGGDALSLVRLQTPDPFTYPKNYKDKRLADQRFKTISSSIEVGRHAYASSQLSELYFQGIRSIPSERAKLVICDYLARHHDLEGVAGFYQSGNRWRLNLSGKGYLRPYRDERNRIIGLFVYHNSIPGLLTSEGLYKGSPAIQPLEQEEREVA